MFPRKTGLDDELQQLCQSHRTIIKDSTVGPLLERNSVNSRVLETPMFIETCAGPSQEPFIREASALPTDWDKFSLSHGHGLGAAKGAFMAIAFEALAAICVYGVWHLWRVLR